MRNTLDRFYRDRHLIVSVVAYAMAFDLCCQKLVKSKHERYALSHTSGRKLYRTCSLGVFYIYKTFPEKKKKKQPNKKTNENVLKREKAVPRFLMNLRFIHLNQRFYYKASVTCHSQLSAYSKGNTHSTSHCKHVEQCHIWGNKTRAAYMLVWFCINKRNHL